MTDRIKLAEAMGWTRSTIGAEYCWRHSDGRMIGMCPDPFTDANDCEALIRWLNDNGVYQLEVCFNKDRHFIKGFRDGNPTRLEIDRIHSYDDWKQGVCELALKVIEEAAPKSG